jgi:hypothetical protein
MLCLKDGPDVGNVGFTPRLKGLPLGRRVLDLPLDYLFQGTLIFVGVALGLPSPQKDEG